MQEIYYDANELRHLVYRGSPELDEEGNIIPLPEIPTSIDPQKDPDYSSWEQVKSLFSFNWEQNCSTANKSLLFSEIALRS